MNKKEFIRKIDWLAAINYHKEYIDAVNDLYDKIANGFYVFKEYQPPKKQLDEIVIPGKMTSPMLHVMINALSTVIHKELRFGDKKRTVTGMTACGWNWKIREWEVTNNWKYVTCQECLKVGRKRSGWS